MKKQLLLITVLMSSGISYGSAVQVNMKTAAPTASTEAKLASEGAIRAQAVLKLIETIHAGSNPPLIIPTILTAEDLEYVAKAIKDQMTQTLTLNSKANVKLYRAMSQQIRKTILDRTVVPALDTHFAMNTQICRALIDIFSNQARTIFEIVPDMPQSLKLADLTNDLLQAIYLENNKAVTKLVKTKTLINKPIAYLGITPLMLACYLKNPKLVEIILNAGADVTMRDYQGNTAMHYLFMDQCSNDRTLSVANEIFYLDILVINPQFTKSLINVHNNHGFTPLMIASLIPFYSTLVKKLIEYGAIDFITDKWGNTALDLAQNPEFSEHYNGWYNKKALEKHFPNMQQTRAQVKEFLTNAQQVFERTNENVAHFFDQLAKTKDESAKEVELAETVALESALAAQEAKKAREKEKKEKKKKKAQASKPQQPKMQTRPKPRKPAPLPTAATTAAAVAPAIALAFNTVQGPAKPSFNHDATKSAFSAPPDAKKPEPQKQSEKHSPHAATATQEAASIANQLEEQLALHEVYKDECEELIKNGTKEQLPAMIEMRDKYNTIVKTLQKFKCPRTDFDPIYKKYFIKISNKAKSFNQ